MGRVIVGILVHFLSLSSLIQAVAETQPCPDNWVEFIGSCYYIAHNQAKTFTDARTFCDDLSSHLVRIDNAAEQAFLKAFLTEIKAAEHYIGINDIQHEGTWVWEDTGSRANFTAWWPSQPGSEAGNEDCVVIAPQYAYKWADLPCSAQRQPLCEKKAAGGEGSELVG